MMQWDEVMAVIVTDILKADAELVGPTGLDGNHIYAAPASRPARIPSVEYTIIGDVELEVFNPIDVQFDVLARAPQLFVIERRIRALLTRNGRRRMLAGINMATLYEDGFTLDYPDAGVSHRALRFRFEPVRRRAAADS